MQEHLRLLGFKVRDVVSGITGIVTSISFDISGCIQGLVTPEVDKDGKYPDSRWIDTKRLKEIADMSVMPIPTFSSVPGGQELPAYSEKPS
jgi:hypothetical protein